MKKYLWFLGAMVAVVGLFFAFDKPKSEKILGTTSESINSTPSNYANKVDLDFEGKAVSAAWYKVTDTYNLELIPNFENRDEAVGVYQKNSCKFLVSGSFYTKDAKPIGLFIANGISQRGYVKSSLADGILSVNYIGTPRITRNVPEDGLEDALQAGPIIKENAGYKRLAIVEDKEARRVVAAVTGGNELYFLIFYNRSSAYLGPYLAKMPEVLKTFEEKTKIEFADAINLDGGSASAFYVNGFSLTEIAPVGGFFCEK